MQIRLIVVGYLEFLLGALGFIHLLPKFQVAISIETLPVVPLLMVVSGMAAVWGLTLTVKAVTASHGEVISLNRTTKAISALLAGWLWVAIMAVLSPIVGCITTVAILLLYLFTR